MQKHTPPQQPEPNRAARRHPIEHRLEERQRLLGIDETARMLGIGRTSVFALIRDGKLLTVKCGRRRLAPIESVAAYIEALIEEAKAS